VVDYASIMLGCIVYSPLVLFCLEAQGMVMGIASPSGHVMLYDPTSEAQDPFSKRHVDCLGMEQKGIDWSDMQFSDDDQYLALACTLGVVLLDAIDLGEVYASVCAVSVGSPHVYEATGHSASQTRVFPHEALQRQVFCGWRVPVHWWFRRIRVLLQFTPNARDEGIKNDAV
jgi:hypothetical protein